MNEVYEKEVKPISTRRFNEALMENPDENLHDPNFKGDSYITFDPEASYDSLNLNAVPVSNKPDFVPGLVL